MLTCLILLIRVKMVTIDNLLFIYILYLFIKSNKNLQFYFFIIHLSFSILPILHHRRILIAN